MRRERITSVGSIIDFREMIEISSMLKLWMIMLRMLDHNLTQAPALNLMRGFYIYLLPLLWNNNQLNDIFPFQMIQNLLVVNLTMV